MAISSLATLEQALGVEFHDKQLLQQAFVHRSYLNELLENKGQWVDNERLEFLGDAVLSYIFSELLYLRFPDAREGRLTNLRSALVRRETLAHLARQLHLGDYLLLGHGEEESGGRHRPATLCATFEALIGAIYLDQGADVCRKVLVQLFAEELEKLEQIQESRDPKSRLQEFAQETFGHTPRYKEIDSRGPDHDKYFVMVVQINGRPYGIGEGRSKQEASQQAAAMALHRLGVPLEGYTYDFSLAERYGLTLASG
ncbi:ribonuclease III [Caldilinea sp.]|uniref:ribonuclease III n=1 Tax=Caldilinea sp. TaxID=2293560 RepID=UPI0021DD363B|nr:ribonuclease III [Caldilinea sp.]GIV69005.1 MAG: ribonuclease 3 [Caldilinea sp.]